MKPKQQHEILKNQENLRNLKQFIHKTTHSFSNWKFYLIISVLLKKIIKKIPIREIKHLLTDADSNTDIKKILLVRQNSPKKLFFCAAILHPL